MKTISVYTSVQRNGTPCPYCIRALGLLKRKGLPFTEIDLSGRPNERMLLVEKAGGSTTVPQIFIGDEHVGGSDELHDLDARGGLNPLLVDA